uniref:Solute carrier family 30 member 1b n=1 Tax=Cyprinus carpio TaxID=7962 RepID=A0A8C2BF76_CYPCA
EIGIQSSHNQKRNVKTMEFKFKCGMLILWTYSDSLNIKITAKGSLEDLDHSSESSSQMNMRGVFLHVLGDALGSVIVVVNALIFTFVWTPCHSDEICFNPCRSSHLTEHQHVNTTVLSQSKTPDRMPRTVSVAGPCWVLYLDPTLCLIMVCILLYTAFPLLKESALILLQTVPKQIDMHKLNGRLRRLDGVMAVHDLHIWQLAGSRIIATVHIKCTDPASYMDIAKRIKDIFHDEGIHATTVQPEFSLISEGSGDSQCELSCRNQCKPKLCCNPTKRAKPVSETYSFSCHRMLIVGLKSCRYLWITVMFSLTVWTLILTAPIHCKLSTVEQVM